MPDRKPCARCGGPKGPGKSKKLCEKCPPLTRREHAELFKERREPKPCRRCGGSKPRGSKALCGACPPLGVNESARRYYRANPEKVKAASRAWAEANPERARANALRSHHANPERKLFQLAKARAKKQGLEFTLLLPDVVIPEACPVLGIPLFKDGSRHGFNDNSPTLDRRDNRLGYVAENVHVISWRANRIKCDATAEELYRVALYAERGPIRRTK